MRDALCVDCEEIDSNRIRSLSDAAPRRVKVVGYDGSANGRLVVEGAARRVGPGGRLIIVHALERAGADLAARYDEICRQMLSELDPTVLEGIDYELRVVAARPATALIDVAAHTNAEAIVIGTRRSPTRLGQRTIRSELEAGPVPVSALITAEQASHPSARAFDSTSRQSFDSFPASDAPSSWSGPDRPGRRRLATGSRGTAQSSSATP
jgi:nucleotide-binding universal stress UspA family protein